MEALTIESTPAQGINPVRGAVQQYPILSFIALACLFGWLFYPLAYFGIGSNPGNFPIGPIIAALIVAACQGRPQLRAWGRRLRNWRASWKWYLVALLAPIAIHITNVLVNHAFGAPLPTSAQWAGAPAALATIPVLLVLIGIGEEAAWTAFVAPILLRRHGFVVAWLLASALRIFWHLPLMLDGNLPWVMGILGNAAFTMVLLQVLVATRGGWQLAAVWHASLNAFGSGFFFPLVTGRDNARLGILLAVAYALLAAVVYFRKQPDPAAVRGDVTLASLRYREKNKRPSPGGEGRFLW
ncbi:CPBP family intramembrane glutamic endopeptidase [Kribbella sp. NPDC051620]|uniref:CPBP family intramembrane glutamic endopeptidase n=1 Tax=Kribbella sp. NPDC051620 TaxID=3364120 RepID=UPI0037B74099